MSAVEALAEVLAEHNHTLRYRNDAADDDREELCRCGEWFPVGDMLPHAAQTLVAAIRSMPAEQKKELGVSPEANGEQK